MKFLVIPLPRLKTHNPSFVNLIWVLVCLQFFYALSLHLCEFCLDIIVKVCVAKILGFSRVYYGM